MQFCFLRADIIEVLCISYNTVLTVVMMIGKGCSTRVFSVQFSNIFHVTCWENLYKRYLN